MTGKIGAIFVLSHLNRAEYNSDGRSPDITGARQLCHGRNRRAVSLGMTSPQTVKKPTKTRRPGNDGQNRRTGEKAMCPDCDNFAIRL
jgi:hypothetical protein